MKSARNLRKNVRPNYDESDHTNDLPSKVSKRRKTVYDKSNGDDDDFIESMESIRKDARRVRMTNEEEEILLTICLKYFDDINDTSTMRGIPGSASIKQREERQKAAWQNVAKEMNAQTTVDIELLNISVW